LFFFLSQPTINNGVGLTDMNLLFLLPVDGGEIISRGSA
jgi:hypothetical protein